jgi:adenylosuccinate synthase
LLLVFSVQECFLKILSIREDAMKKRERFGAVVIVVGMQYGSEGKGAIASYLAPIASVGVRSGAANAGHTVYWSGRRFIMRQVPSAWINPWAKLVIGAGAIINLDILLNEIGSIDPLLPIKNRLIIDPHAHVVTPEHISKEQLTDLASRIGSCSATTKEGIGAAMAAKVLREGSCLLAGNTPELKRYLGDTSLLINESLEKDGIVLLEGAQGFGLSLDHGHFPYVTSRDTGATALAASVGIATHEFPVSVIGVTRTYPIRVAGNSGPFGQDAQEITWKEVTRRAGSRSPIIERTSVSNKIRRVATFSKEEFAKACLINRPTEIAITFADYLDWRLHEKTDDSPKLDLFIDMVESIADAPVTLVKTGPRTTMDLDAYRSNILRRIT